MCSRPTSMTRIGIRHHWSKIVDGLVKTDALCQSLGSGPALFAIVE